MVGILLSYWEGLFSGAKMLVSGRVVDYTPANLTWHLTMDPPKKIEIPNLEPIIFGGFCDVSSRVFFRDIQGSFHKKLQGENSNLESPNSNLFTRVFGARP